MSHHIANKQLYGVMLTYILHSHAYKYTTVTDLLFFFLRHRWTHLIILLLLDFCRSWCSLMTHSWYSCFWISVTCCSSLVHLFSKTFQENTLSNILVKKKNDAGTELMLQQDSSQAESPFYLLCIKVLGCYCIYILITQCIPQLMHDFVHFCCLPTRQRNIHWLNETDGKNLDNQTSDISIHSGMMFI